MIYESSQMRDRLIHPTTLVLLVIALGFALRLFHLDTQSFWYDEAFSAGVVRGTSTQILGNDFRDVHPPLYYLILHLWLPLGESDFTIRLLSAILGVAGIAAIYSLGKTLFTKTVGLTAATIAAVAPYKIFYSQEARMYTLLFLLSCTLLLSYFRMLRTDSPTSWLAYTASAVCGLYVHYFSVLLLLSIHLHALVDRNRGAKRWHRLAKTDGLLILGVIPQVVIFQGQAQRVASDFWISRPTLARLFSAPYGLTLTQFPTGSLAPFAFAVTLLLFIVTHLQVARGLARRKKDSAGLTLISLAFWTPLLLSFITSQWVPVYLEKALIVAVPALYLLVSWGVVRTKEHYANLGLLLLLALFAINALHNWYFDPAFGKPSFRSAARFLQDEARIDEPILHTSDGGYVIFLHYVPEYEHYLLGGDPNPQLPLETYPLLGGEITAKEDLPSRRFWLAVALDNSVEFQRRLVGWFDGHHKLVRSYDIGGINLRYYDDTRATLERGITTSKVSG